MKKKNLDTPSVYPSYHNDKTGYFKEYPNINFNISHLFQLNRLPLFLMYMLDTNHPQDEKELLKIETVNVPKLISCKECGKIYKTTGWLKFHIKKMDHGCPDS